MKKIFFLSKDGTKLAGIWHTPQKPTKKAVILAHGITVDKDEDGIFIDQAELLKENGFAVFRFDFRGHGDSGGKSTEMTIKGEIKDLESAVREVYNHGFTEIGLLGASFGGGISVLFTAQNPDKVKCLCLWNPVLNYDHCFLNPFLPWLKDKIIQMKKDIKTKGWTELGERKFKIGRALFKEMKRTFPYRAMKKIFVPTLVIHGSKDTYVPYEDPKNYLQNLKRLSELITIEGAEHGLDDTEEHFQKALQETLYFFQRYLKEKF